jgi:PAS domain S-box-containing protein
MGGPSLEPIRVLHVDDNPDFADLTMAFLERESNSFDIETATSATDGLAAIENKKPDCIVSDYDMPGTNGLEFLETIRETYSDLPFILFTGKGSEQIASDAIAAGVTDYLQKKSGSEQYELLANRIRHAVNAERSAQRATRQEELRRLTEHAGDIGGFELSVEHGELSLTEGTRRLIDIPEEKSLSPTEAIALYHPDDQEDVRETLERAATTGNATHGIWQLQTFNDNDRFVDVTITPVTTNEEVTVLRGSIRDITDREERQQELRLLQHAIDTTNAPITLSDPTQNNNPLTYVNEAFEELTGYPSAELLGTNCRFLQGEATDSKKVTILREAIAAEEPVTVTLRNYRKDGTMFWNRLSISPIYDDDGNLIRYLGTQVDVTAQKRREQQLAELNQITQTLLKAKSKQEIADIGVQAAKDVLNLQATAIHFSTSDHTRLVPAAYTDKLSLLLGDIQPLPVTDSIAGRVYRSSEPTIVDCAKQDPDVYNPETELEGHLYLPLGDHGVLIVGSEQPAAFDEQDLSLGELLSGNITAALDRLERGELARVRQKQLSLFFDESPLGAVQWDENFRFKRLNQRARNILGYDDPDLRGESWDTIVADDDQKEVGSVVDELLDADGGKHVINKNVKKNGEVITCEWHNRAVTDVDGNVESVFSLFQIVDERENHS